MKNVLSFFLSVKNKGYKMKRPAALTSSLISDLIYVTKFRSSSAFQGLGSQDVSI
jgi:hypothetical protein